MKTLIKYFLALFCCIQIVFGQRNNRRLVCYYDSESSLRPGFAQFPLNDLENALSFCTHLVYGYAGLNRKSFDIFSLNVDRDMFHFREITAMKYKYPHLKVYLSMGGDADIDEVDPDKYIHFLESGTPAYKHFISSAIDLLNTNNFDGLDLAFQFPRNKPRKVHSQIGTIWKKIKKVFTGDFIVDPDADTHKKQFTEFIDDLGYSLHIANLSMTLTVLPNVNSTWYFDISTIQYNFEYINLFAFDFLTPERNPEEADFTAPIYLKEGENRLPHYNIDYQVNYWLQNGCPAHKLNLGIATYARTWKLTTDSGLSGMPVVQATKGPAEGSLQSRKSGILSWPEVCAKVSLVPAGEYRGPNAPLHKVVDMDRRYGNYAFRPADDNNEYGVWASFDDPDFAGIKAEYAKRKGLGGMAIYDLAYDDFRGLCTGSRFPILRSIRGYL